MNADAIYCIVISVQCCVCGGLSLAPFVVHCLSEKKKQPDEGSSSRTVYQPFKHPPNSAESNSGDGAASVDMPTLVDDRGRYCCVNLLPGDNHNNCNYKNNL